MKLAIGSFLLLLALFASLSVAFPNYLSTFNTRYGTAGTVLDICGVCHGASTLELNLYGQSFADSLEVHPNVDSALVYIEQLDSDGDGVLNIHELMGRSLPGDPDSTTPVETLTWGKLKQLFK